MKTPKIIADICLYGTPAIGHGWLAAIGETRIGTGEPKPGRSKTDCVWEACDIILRTMGICGDRPKNASVRIFEPKGQLMAIASLNHPGYFGDLKWERAIQYEIQVA